MNSTILPNGVKVPTIDADSYCRLCFSTESIEVLFPIGQYPRENILTLIRLTVGIEITMEDDYPCAVCRCCQKTLNGFMKFRERCQQNHEAVRLLRSNHTTVGTMPTVTKTPELVSLLSRGSKPPVPEEISATVDAMFRAPSAKKRSYSRSRPSGDKQAFIATVSLEDPMVFCNVCSVGFETHEELSLHAVEQHNSCGQDDKHYKCSSCPRSYSSLSALKAHTASHRSKVSARKRQAASKRSEPEPVSIPLVKEPLPSYEDAPTVPFIQHTCPLCPLVFASEEQLHMHTDMAHEPVELMQHMFSEESSIAHNVDASYSACEATIEPIVELNADVANPYVDGSSEDGKFQCRLCFAKFVVMRMLKNHHDKWHASQKFYIQCEQCGQLLTQNQLRYHHDPKLGCGVKELPFSCPTCQKRFRRERDLKRHKGQSHDKAEAGKSAAIAAAGENVVQACKIVLERLSEDRIREILHNGGLGKVKKPKKKKRKCSVMPIIIKQEVEDSVPSI